MLGGGNSNIFGIFTPKIGEDFQFEDHIFQMGWFNHQPGMLCFHVPWFCSFQCHSIKPSLSCKCQPVASLCVHPILFRQKSAETNTVSNE